MQAKEIKQILVFSLISVFFLLAGFFTHQYVLQSTETVVNYSLFAVYLFFALSAIFIFSIVLFVSTIVPDKTGLAFLALIMVKLGFFLLLFYKTTLGTEGIAMAGKVGIIVPLFLFMILESAAVFRFLNKQ